MTLFMEWHEFHYPSGRSGKESQPQFVAYLACPALCDITMAAEVVEILDGMGGYILSRYLCYGCGADSDRTFNSWHRSVDDAYAAAYTWAHRRAAQIAATEEWEAVVEEALEPEWLHRLREDATNWKVEAERHAEFRQSRIAGQNCQQWWPYKAAFRPKASARSTRLWQAAAYQQRAEQEAEAQ